MKTSHEMAQSVLKRKKIILRRRSNILTALGATGGTAAIIVAFALIFSIVKLRETQPVITVVTTGSATTAISETVPLEEETDPLRILQYRTNEEGEREVYVTPEEWEKMYDFDLFREYFFGEWKITEGQSLVTSDSAEPLPFIIDDCEKSFFPPINGYRLTDRCFYRISENVLAFAINSDVEIDLFWLDINTPDIMYSEFFYGSEDGSFSRPSPPEYTTICLYSKTNAPINVPEKSYLSIFRLCDISREYGIDFDMLVNFKYDTEIDGHTVNLLHDDWYQFYPIYIVSEEANKLTFKTTVGNVYYPDVMQNITYTIEKVNGKWIRTADPPEGEFAINEDLISELGMTFGELTEKYDCEPEGAFNSYSFEKGYGRYVWKSPDGNVYENMEQAGGCNMIDGVRVKLLLSGVSYPLSFETLEENGFTPISIGDEPGMDYCFWASFSHPDFEGVTFTFYTKEYGVIGENESCFLTAESDETQNAQEEISTFKAVAEEAAEAYLGNDRERLSPYLYDPDYDTGLVGMSGSIIGRTRNGELILPTETAPLFEVDKEYKAVYRFTLDGEDMLFYLDLTLIKTGEGWRVKAIDFQG